MEFFSEQTRAHSGLRNTLIYAVVTSGLKVVLGLLLAVLLTSRIRARGLLRSVVFFPVLVSTVAVGITFSVLLQARHRASSTRRSSLVGIHGPRLARPTRPPRCCRSRSSTSGRASGMATVIYIAGILSIPRGVLRGGRASTAAAPGHKFRHVTCPLSRPRPSR